MSNRTANAGNTSCKTSRPKGITHLDGIYLRWPLVLGPVAQDKSQLLVDPELPIAVREFIV